METAAPRVGERLQQFRKQRGLSQRGLAPLLNVSHATISKWETGNAPIDADLLPALGEVLGVHPSEFFGGVAIPSSYSTLPGDELAEEFKAFIGSKVDRLPPHEQRAVYLAAGIVDTLLARAG